MSEAVSPTPSEVASGGANEAARPSTRDHSVLALALAAGALALIVAGLAPTGFPSWPGVSLGLGALALSRRPGRPMARALAAFGGLAAVVVGGLKIAGLHVLASLW